MVTLVLPTHQSIKQKEKVVTIILLLKSFLDSHCHEKEYRYRSQMEQTLVSFKCHYHRERRACTHTNKGREHQSEVRRNKVAVGRRAGEGNRLLLCFLHLSALPNCHSGQKWQHSCSQLIPAKLSPACLKGANMTSRSPRMPASFQVANVIRKGLLLCMCFCLSG